MHLFNLTFQGEIQPGRDPEKVKRQFAEILGIEDPADLDACFTGERVTLRQDLDRKTAADLYHKLYVIGANTQLLRDDGTTTANSSATKTSSNKSAAANVHRDSMSHRDGDHVDMKWAVSSAAQAESRRATKAKAESAAARARASEAAAAERRKAEARKQAEILKRKLAVEREAQERARLEQERVEAARLAEKAAAERKAAEEAEARRQAEAEREAAEEAEAKRQAEAERKAVEEAEARRKAEAERKAAEEAEARRKAEAERKAAEEAEARRKAEAERKAAEEAEARRKAEAERKAVEEAEARRKAEAERKAAEEAEARRKAEAERKAAEEAEAKRQAEAERKAAEEAEAKRQADARAEARRQRAVERKAAKAAKAEARRQAAAERKSAQAARKAAERHTAAERKAAQQARAETDHPAVKPQAPVSPARSATTPNLYALFPFRVTTGLRERPQRARILARRYLACSVLSLVLLILTAIAGQVLRPQPAPTGASAIAAQADGGLILALPDELLLHDRAGVGSERLPLASLGLSDVEQLRMAADGESHFLLARSLPGVNGEPGNRGLWRCRLATGECQPHGPRAPLPATFAVHALSGMMLQAVPEPWRLRKLDPDGELQGEVAHDFGEYPGLQPRDGLLYVASTEGPALSVLRYEDNALGVQLDEIILLAPQALEAGRERVAALASNSSRWWVVLANPETGERGVYQFDQRFGFERELPLPEDFQPRHLLAWGEKLLVLDPAVREIARFSAEGTPEVPFRSDLLAEEIESRESALQRHTLITQGLQGFAWLAFIACGLLAWYQDLRQIAFKPEGLRGAEPIDGIGKEASWIPLTAHREARLRRLARLYLSLTCFTLVLAVVVQVETRTLAALMLLLGGPALSLWLFIRSRIGHIGVLDDRLLLVDHRGTYHVGSGARIRYRGWFLMIDDVLVYSGPRFLPAFDTDALQRLVLPVVERGARSDRRGLLVRLIESRHPLALAAGICTMAAMAAATLLLDVI